MTLTVAIKHSFGSFDLDATFEAPSGLTVLFGRSGCGKTTIVNSIAGLIAPQHGRIGLNNTVLFDSEQNVSVPTHKRRLGAIFQDARLFPHMSVVQNLKYGTRFRKTPPKAKQAQQIIEMLALENLLDRRPTTLSGGEKQRVAIGRALLADPAIILADEPLAALDAQRKTEILPYFERLRDETDIPIIYVSHSVTEVARLATTVVALDNGKVLASGAPEDVLSNADVTPVGVRSVGSLLKAKVKAHHPDGLTELDAQGLKLFLPKLNNPIGSSVRVRIAAHDVMLSSSKPKDISALNILPGTINKIRAGDGPAAIVTLQTDAGLILARLTQRSIDRMNLKVGSRSYAIIKSVAVAPQDIGNGLSQNP